MSKRRHDPAPAGFTPEADQEPTPPATLADPDAAGAADRSTDQAAAVGRSAEASEPDPLDQPARNNDAPICPIHKQECEVRSSPQAGNAFFRYYRCPVEGCRFSHKVPRKTIRQRLAEQQADERFSAR